MILQKAQRMAETIVVELAPFCERITVAGSIRRQRPMVNDIDIVALPRIGQEQAFRDRCMQRASVVTNAPQTLVVILENKVQLDIWIASPKGSDLFEPRPCNYGSLLLVRTGSKAHNIHLINHAKSLGMTWNTYWGVFDYTGRNCVAADTEEEIFKALKLEFVPPEKRER